MKAHGGSWPPHDDPNKDDTQVYFPDDEVEGSGLHVFFQQSDCDGQIDHKHLKDLADEMEALLPKIVEQDSDVGNPYSTSAKAELFIKGCRLAYSENEPLIFQ
jgi:hypothetical protein